ncbi:MAG: bleomycin resistance protein [Caulobacterales bacterium]
MLKRAIPLLHVSASKPAEAFYRERLGFALRVANRGEAADPCFMSLSRDGIELHLSSFAGDGVAGGAVTFIVDDVDALHRELAERGAPIALAPVDQTWGSREMYVQDPDGNSIRFQAWGSGGARVSLPAGGKVSGEA